MSNIFQQTGVYENGLEFRQEELDNYVLDYIEARDKERLIITFESMFPEEEDNLGICQRYPWGGKFIFSQGFSVIGVKCRKPDWYRGEDLHLFFMSDDFQKFLECYDSVYLYGNSMGGYAALAFAGVIPEANVLALCPQSTLDKRLVSWDTRFPMGVEQNWAGYFRDAAESLNNVGNIYVLYDPFFPADKTHVDRLPQDKIIHLKASFFQHDVAVFLSEMGLLKDVFLHFIQGDLYAWFHQNIRGRREYLKYLSTLFFHWALRCYKKGDAIRALYIIQQGVELCPGNRLAGMLMQDIQEGKMFQWSKYYQTQAQLLS